VAGIGWRQELHTHSHSLPSAGEPEKYPGLEDSPGVRERHSSPASARRACLWPGNLPGRRNPPSLPGRPFPGPPTASACFRASTSPVPLVEFKEGCEYRTASVGIGRPESSALVPAGGVGPARLRSHGRIQGKENP
jgi:hypothetical protein